MGMAEAAKEQIKDEAVVVFVLSSIMELLDKGVYEDESYL